jgi:hypothetical protein
MSENHLTRREALLGLAAPLFTSALDAQACQRRFRARGRQARTGPAKPR